MELSASDDGTRRSIAQGELINLWMTENPTTGYRWELASAGFVIRADSYEPSGAAMGSPGTRRLELQPTEPGDLTLYLVRRRAWESPQTPPVEEFTVHLTVTGDDQPIS
jgi:predicted secreted protein